MANFKLVLPRLWSRYWERIPYRLNVCPISASIVPSSSLVGIIGKILFAARCWWFTPVILAT
jgi:hypothetical protein